MMNADSLTEAVKLTLHRLWILWSMVLVILYKKTELAKWPVNHDDSIS